MVDSARATAADVRAFLRGAGWRAEGTDGAVELLVTDIPRTFAEVAARFLGDAVGRWSRSTCSAGTPSRR